MVTERGEVRNGRIQRKETSKEAEETDKIRPCFLSGIGALGVSKSAENVYNEDKEVILMFTGAYIVPHPPIILPEIGRGEEKIIQNTCNAFHMIAHDVASKKPDTILVISPHAPSYQDYIQISSGQSAYGNFAAFQAEDVEMKVLYDEDIVTQLSTAAQACGLPAGTRGIQDGSLDHGTMVPLYFILQEYSDCRFVRISVSGLDKHDQLAFGNCIRQVMENSEKRIAIIASGDLSHKLKEDGPYGFAPEGVVFDKTIVDILKNNDYKRLLDIDQQIVQRSANCGYPAFLMLTGALEGYPIDTQFLTYEGPFGVGYATAMIQVMRKDAYVALARESLEYFVTQRKVLPLRPTMAKPLLDQRAGVFVSLKKEGELRGCIGTITPMKECLAEEIISNAIAAGSRDPRFMPVETHELSQLEYSVDVLAEPEMIQSLEELDVERYGVIVSDGYRKGVLLPDLQGVDTPLQQVEIALHKAGMDPEEPFVLERFEVVRHHEYPL